MYGAFSSTDSAVFSLTLLHAFIEPLTGKDGVVCLWRRMLFFDFFAWDTPVCACVPVCNALCVLDFMGKQSSLFFLINSSCLNKTRMTTGTPPPPPKKKNSLPRMESYARTRMRPVNHSPKRRRLWLTASNPSTSVLSAFPALTNSGSKWSKCSCNNLREPKIQQKSRPCGFKPFLFCSCVSNEHQGSKARASFAKRSLAQPWC